MNVVDSSAWLAYFADAPNARFFAEPIEEPDSLIVPSIALYEVFRRLHQQRSENAAMTAVAFMARGHVVDLGAKDAIEAALLAARHRLPLADAVILEAARRHDATLWTQDTDFEGMDGVTYEPHVAG